MPPQLTVLSKGRFPDEPFREKRGFGMATSAATWDRAAANLAMTFTYRVAGADND